VLDKKTAMPFLCRCYGQVISQPHDAFTSFKILKHVEVFIRIVVLNT